jgi:ATP-binding cassette subfamily C protein LapB
MVLSFELAAVVAFGMVLSLLLGVYTVRRNFRSTTSVNELSTKARGMVSSAWTGADAVRAFGGRELYRKQWKRRMAEVDMGRRRADDGREFGQGLTGGASVLVRVGIYAVGARLVVEGELTFAALIGASILGSYAVQKITAFVQTWPAMSQATTAKARLDEFFSLPLEETSGRVPESYNGGVELRGVSYAFPGSVKPLYADLSVRLEPGQVMAVAGPNGSGKTTFMRLVAGLLSPTAGGVYVGGLDLAEVDADWWRRRLMYMPQEPTFVSAGLRENLVSANPDMDQDALNNVVRDADLRHFVDSSPQGMETSLAGGGANLPLGTRKRLALARALCTGDTLMLLDEPTEGLDAEGRNAVYRVMNRLAGEGKAIIAVTSDPNILKGAGLVLDLGAGPVPKVHTKEPGGAPGSGAGSDQGGES